MLTTEAFNALLKTMEEPPANVVFILSGRTREVLFDWFGSLPKLGIAAEKGVFIRWPGSPGWEAMPNLGDFSWKAPAYDLMKSVFIPVFPLPYHPSLFVGCVLARY
jgi:trehalose-6-phosphatase